MKAKRHISLLGIILALFITFSSDAQTVTNTVTTANSCKDDGSITITVDETYLPYSISLYPFKKNSTPITMGPINQTSYTISNLMNGDYYVYLYQEQDENVFGGNSYSVNIGSSIDVSFTRVQADCKGNNGSITAAVSGGTAPYSYLWENGGTTNAFTTTNVQTGLVVTDASGCIYHASDSLIIYNSPSFYVEMTNNTLPSCNALGTVTATATSINATQDTYTYYWNTDPIQLTQTATELQDGEYTVVVTNSQGCTVQAIAEMYRAANEFNLNLVENNATCSQSNGSATATGSDGTAPYTYLWSTGETTSTVSDLKSYLTYIITATDANGCKSTKSFYIQNSSPIQASFVITPSNCTGGGGGATVTASNGVAPYTYLWTGGNTTASITGVDQGYYYVIITDANGCSTNASIGIPAANDCFIELSGTVYYDVNGNNIQDAGEINVPSDLQLNNDDNNQLYSIGGYSGYYADFQSPGNYTLSVMPPDHWKLAPGALPTLTVSATVGGNTYSGNNFALVPSEIVTDVYVAAYIDAQRPGYTRSASIYYANKGTQVASGTIMYVLSDNCSITSTDPAMSNYDPATRTATWNYSDLQLFEQRVIYLETSAATNAAMGTVVTATATITTQNTDVDLSDNQSTCFADVQSAFDPNEIQVSPQGTGNEGYITDAEDELTYKIQFQNTGTDVAYNISVTSTIDDNLEDYTFALVSSSHPCTTTNKNNLLTFNFSNINLPDSTLDRNGSHGYVIYKIKRKTDLAPDTKIYNQANIYFDYNAAVATNQVYNTIARVTATVNADQSAQDVVLYPNPSSNQVSVRFNAQEENNVSIQLYSATGQEIPLAENQSVSSGNNVIDLNLAPYNLVNGLYIVKLVVGNKSYTKNLVLSR